MATILKAAERKFKETPGKIEGFRINTDISRTGRGVEPENLNFDLRQLAPGQCSAPYHFHRCAEELFFIVSGSALLRSCEGIRTVGAGDIIFFEKGETGSHQLYNHTGEPCMFLDVRSFTGADICEYPDTGKILLVPSMEMFRRGTAVPYFEGEENIQEKWAGIAAEKNDK